MAEPEFIQSKPEGEETNPSCSPDPGTTLSKGEPVRSDRPSSGTNRASSSSSRSSDRPSSGTSRLSDRTGSSASKASHCAHSRTSSSSSGDGLLLSVSALARAGGRGTGQDTEGGTRHAPEPDKAELGGSEQSYNSLDSEHSCTCSGGEGMGQREGRPTPPVAEREEPEGLEEGRK
ncbi:uncharacterized protein LOC111712446 [Eurytemora carolleeae]|uniref:uncharacterized protein LOC111712446 n=1 Tax=Eurytemora carolleeae TaxID=1294199 RepID=UPI000C774199|nr:uncharacterized protein LOC111712446 [Eurytemora carolleeae]|eukprot:XP_023342814.1 uncharacterized protein LOC111712446 [Eurytemora affinis]